MLSGPGAGPVSYTHLDVYKRQATRIVNKDGAILIIRWKYAPDYLTVEKLLENDIVLFDF